MTRPALLVSVRNAAEARAARGGGAAWVDVKEPARGPLGRPDDAVIRAVVDACPNHPVTAAWGDLADTTPSRVPPGLRLVKVGLADAARDWPDLLAHLAKSIGPGRVIATAYADHHRAAAPSPAQVHAAAERLGLAGVLIDTAIKDDAGLLAWTGPTDLAPIVAACRASGRLVALAGSLGHDDIPAVCAIGPDIIAVRGAACAGGHRDAVVSADRVAAVARRIAECALPRASA